ncbi:MAG: hypothetical protein ABSH01_18425 [Terriglobia bacterium]
MAKRGRKTRGKAGYMISAVAGMYNIFSLRLTLPLLARPNLFGGD